MCRYVEAWLDGARMEKKRLVEEGDEEMVGEGGEQAFAVVVTRSRVVLCRFVFHFALLARKFPCDGMSNFSKINFFTSYRMRPGIHNSPAG